MSNSAKKVFKAFRASFLAKNDDWKDMLAEDVSLIGPLAQVQGKAAFIEVNEAFFASITASEVLEVVKKGDLIITQITTDVATPDEAGLQLHVNEWYTIQNGLIQSLRVYFDTYDFRRAYGLDQ